MEESSVGLSQRKSGPPIPGGLSSVSDSPSRPSPGKSVSFNIGDSSHRSPSIRSRPVPGDMTSSGRVKSVPGDMVKSDRGLTSFRQPPNPGGMDAFSSPSPGGRPKRAPSPGNFSSAPPDLAASSQSGSDDPSPPKTTTQQRFIFTKNASGVVPPSSLSVSSSVQKQPNQEEIENYESTQQRFIFTKNASGVLPPSSLSVSSSVQKQPNQEEMKHFESKENIRIKNPVASPRKQKEVKPITSKKKNPVGHAFLRKMNWSDSDESDEDDLEVYSQSKLSEHTAKDKDKSGHSDDMTNVVTESSRVQTPREIDESSGGQAVKDKVRSNKSMIEHRESKEDTKISDRFKNVIAKASECSDIQTKKVETLKGSVIQKAEKAPVTDTNADCTEIENAPDIDNEKTMKSDRDDLIVAKSDRKGKNVDLKSSSPKLNDTSNSKSSKMAFLSRANLVTKNKEKKSGHSSSYKGNGDNFANKVSLTSKKIGSKESISQKLDISKKIEDDLAIKEQKIQCANSSDNASIGSSSSVNTLSRREQFDRVKKLMVRGRPPSPALQKVGLIPQKGAKPISKSPSQSGKKNPYAVDKNMIMKSKLNVHKVNAASDSKAFSSTRRPSLVSAPSDEITALDPSGTQPSVTKMHSNADRLNVLRQKAAKLRDQHKGTVNIDFKGTWDNFGNSLKESEDDKSFMSQVRHIRKNESRSQEEQNYLEEEGTEHIEHHSVSSLPQKAENVYSGAYSDLLPWSTTPLLFRMYAPTLPSSLVHNTELSEKNQSQGVIVEMKTMDSFRDDARRISNDPVSVDDDNDDINDSPNEPTLPSSLVNSTEISEKNQSQGVIVEMKTLDSFQDDAERISYNAVSVDDQDINYSPKAEVASYVSLAKETSVKSRSSESDDGSNNTPSVHSKRDKNLDSNQMISSTSAVENQNLDIAEWWDQSYAHSQDEEVNQDVMEALSNTMNKSLDSVKEFSDNRDKFTDKEGEVGGDESDDDVFYGLDSYPSPVVKATEIHVKESNAQIDDLDDIMGRVPNINLTNKSNENPLNDGIEPMQSNRRGKNRVSRKDNSELVETGAAPAVVKSRKDRPFDHRSNSSRSTSSDSNDSAIADRMRLSKKERRKWKDWEKRDNGSVDSRSIYSSDYTHDSEDEILERRSRAYENLLLHAYTALSRPPQKIPVEKGMGNTKITVGMDQRQMLDKFCTQIKIAPLEVLKLNRENKWQTRFLTTSKEGSWLKNGNGIEQGDAAFCPLGILWVKKLSRTHDYSISSIDNQGKGGGLFANLARFSIRDEILRQHPLSRKQSEKFRDCIAVSLYFDGDQDSFVTFACSRSSAEVITTGCSAVIDILRGRAKEPPLQQILKPDAIRKQTQSEGMNRNVHVTRGLVSPNNVKVQTVKVAPTKGQRTYAVAKNLSNQGAPHLWEA